MKHEELTLDDPPESHQELPQSLTEVLEVIGLPSTIKLVKEYGGTRIFVPSRLKAQHKLANLLGFEHAQRLSQYFAGESLSIARAANAIRAKRNKDIARRYDEGETTPSLAREYQLTERQVYTILSRATAQKNTLRSKTDMMPFGQ